MGPIKYLATFLCACFFINAANSQLNRDDELFLRLKQQDSLLFHLVFEQCDIQGVRQLLDTDFEFYHDRGGESKDINSFLASIENSCAWKSAGEPSRSKRLLEENALEVYPLYDKGEMYAAIQQGIHRFEYRENGGDWQKGDIARFTHLWKLQGGQWQLSRVMSYDHKPTE